MAALCDHKGAPGCKDFTLSNLWLFYDVLGVYNYIWKDFCRKCSEDTSLHIKILSLKLSSREKPEVTFDDCSIIRN